MPPRFSRVVGDDNARILNLALLLGHPIHTLPVLLLRARVLLILRGAALIPLLIHVISLDPPRSPISVLSQAVKLRPLDVQEHQVGTGISEYDANSSPVWDMS